MKLTEAQIAELHELCGALMDDKLTEAQRPRLATWLAESEDARRLYVRLLDQSASLHAYAEELRPELLAVVPFPAVRWFQRPLWWAASVAVLLSGLGTLWFTRSFESDNGARKEIFVALVTATKIAQWSPGSVLQPGDRIERDRRLELISGLAEIAFDSGARVVLQGPATLEVNSAWAGTLGGGTLTASVPPEAIGFRLSHATVDVVDLGTEFSMIADGPGSAEVLVLKGEVESVARKGDSDVIRLRENEARRFDAGGVTGVDDREGKIARLSQPLLLDRFVSDAQLHHWSFDESGAARLTATLGGAPAPDRAATLTTSDPAALSASRSDGKRGGALRLDGTLSASASIPGLSGGTPHTVAFWVRIPEGAATSAWMVAWSTRLDKLNSRPVHIRWNRQPDDGPFGALRTDFGGGFAIGARDLRDGRWHHVAVCFAPGTDAASPVQVKQYIDGRLESSSVTLTPHRSGEAPLTGAGAVPDILWIGRRLTGNRPERFSGEIDEFFLADHVLDQTEIVSLMNDNRLPVIGVARGP